MSKGLPYSEREFQKAWPRFKDWLVEHGSAIFEPTNPYDIARFLTDSGIGVVYINKSGRVTNWINNSDVAYDAFVSQKAWRAVEKVNRSKKTIAEYKAIVARDGNGCMYCNASLSVDVATIEHVVSITSGGTNHLANKALPCTECNKEAGHLSVRQKIELAIATRASACQ